MAASADAEFPNANTTPGIENRRPRLCMRGEQILQYSPGLRSGEGGWHITRALSWLWRHTHLTWGSVHCLGPPNKDMDKRDKYSTQLLGPHDEASFPPWALCGRHVPLDYDQPHGCFSRQAWQASLILLGGHVAGS